MNILSDRDQQNSPRNEQSRLVRFLRGRLPALRDHWPMFLAISSGFGFLLSITMHSFVFWTWGHNFLQVATPTDIFMSGFGMLFDLLPAALLGLIATMVLVLTAFGVVIGIGLLLGGVTSWREGYFRRLNDAYLEYGANYLFAILVILIPIGIMRLEILGDLKEFVGLNFLIPMGLFLIWVGFERFKEGGFSGIFDLSLLGGFGFLLIASWIGSALEDYDANGLYRVDAPITVQGTSICKRNRLLWVGSETTVIECELLVNGRAVRQILLLHKKSDLVFRAQ